jgi:hypothetical protein
MPKSSLLSGHSLLGTEATALSCSKETSRFRWEACSRAPGAGVTGRPRSAIRCHQHLMSQLPDLAARVMRQAATPACRGTRLLIGLARLHEDLAPPNRGISGDAGGNVVRALVPAFAQQRSIAGPLDAVLAVQQQQQG